MAAKRVVTHRVVAEFGSQAEVAAILHKQWSAMRVVQKCELQEHETFVCSHCGEPWPMGCSPEPMSYEWYRKYGSAEYCCDATRADCEGANE